MYDHLLCTYIDRRQQSTITLFLDCGSEERPSRLLLSVILRKGKENMASFSSLPLICRIEDGLAVVSAHRSFKYRKESSNFDISDH